MSANKRMYSSRAPSGFIALMTAVVIAAVLLVVVVSGGMTGFFTRFDVLDTELKDRSEALADACVDTVMARLATDSSYRGPETVSVDSDTCSILGVESEDSTSRIFKIQAVYQHAYTNALVTFFIDTGNVASWREVATMN
ncbi:MAG: hypothetical protein ACM3TU_00085 [Bacillota bacterium]